MRFATLLAVLALCLPAATLLRGQNAAVPAPPAEDKKNDERGELEEFLKRLPPGTPPEIRKQAEAAFKQVLEARKRNPLNDVPFALPPVIPPVGPDFVPPGFGSGPQATRLGAILEVPSATLAEQLELPKDQGLILKEVPAASAAGKAGLKSHDILLEIDGKPVSRDLREFEKQVEKIKEKTPISVTVMRKGKMETIKELTLPKAELAGPGIPFPGLPPQLPLGPVPPAIAPIVPPPLLPPQQGGAVQTTLFRNADSFTARHEEGRLIITLNGKENKITEIIVLDGSEMGKHESVDKVPQHYRAKVKNLVEMIEKASVKTEEKEKEKDKDKEKDKEKE